MNKQAMSIEQHDRAISANKVRLSEAKEAVHADERLTEHGKAERVRELREAAQAKHAELLTGREAAVKAERERLYSVAFRRGIASVDSYRDVYGRAYRADQRELETLKGQAERTGDVMLGKAVQQAAYDRGLDALLEDAPREVHDLRDFEHAQGLRHNPLGDHSIELTRRLGLSVLRSMPT